MKVLHVLGELNPSGAEVMLREASAFWEEYGIKSTILSTGNNKGVFSEALENAGYDIKHIPFSKSMRHFLNFYKLIKKSNFDVVHIHTERANIIYSLVAKLAGVKRVIRTIHSMFEFDGLLRIRKIIERFFVRILGVYQVSIGNIVKQNEERRFYNKTHVIFNWINTSKFKFIDKEEKKVYKEKLGISKEVFVFTSVGNCSKAKNHVEILKAIHSLVNECNYKNFLYLHVGKEDVCQSERKLVEELGIQEYVKFIGFVEDVRPILYASDLFIMPSLYEGFGIAGLEALSTGLPCVFSNRSGLLEFKSCMNEIIYINPNSKEIKDVLKGYLSGEKKAKQECLKLNIKNARDKFDVVKGTKGYINIYKR